MLFQAGGEGLYFLLEVPLPLCDERFQCGFVS